MFPGASSPRPPLPTADAQAGVVDPRPAPASAVEAPPTLTLLSFGFKYGPPPANHYFDVSFLKNPARQEGWDLFSEPCDRMRAWVLAQPAAVEFLERVAPLAQFLARADDGGRLALGCSAGRHRSAILVEELARRLRAGGLDIRVHHREKDLT